jgi:hypothetical protein
MAAASAATALSTSAEPRRKEERIASTGSADDTATLRGSGNVRGIVEEIQGTGIVRDCGAARQWSRLG